MLAAIKNKPAPTKTQGAFQNQNQHDDSTKPAYFLGTDNPRHLRAIAALLHRPMPRQNLDSVVGCANGPDLVAELRSRGLEIPCERIRFIDRDGYLCRPGVYSFTATDRRRWHQWQAKQGGAT